jgi:hypothetical protein
MTFLELRDCESSQVPGDTVSSKYLPKESEFSHLHLSHTVLLIIMMSRIASKSRLVAWEIDAIFVARGSVAVAVTNMTLLCPLP